MRTSPQSGRTDLIPRKRPGPAVFGMALALGLVLAAGTCASAASIQIDTGGEGGMGTLQLLFLFAIIALAPSLLIMMTSFTRIVIVFSFLRNAIGLQQTPPNQVIIGLSLFLSLFIMQPVLSEVNQNGLEPYMNDEITQEQALEAMAKPLKIFMLDQTNPEELNLFLSLSGHGPLEEVNPETLTGLGMHIIAPAFIVHELKQAFIIGFLLYLPFMVIDMVVSSTLMSMGMVMLPPSMISLPFKLMLFVVLNGWELLIDALVKGFNG